MPISKITYMYRDASNYKFWGEFLVSGTFKITQVSQFLIYGEFFIPHEVGLDHLLSMPMNEDDHYLHTFEGVEYLKSGDVICSSAELIERFQSADRIGWFTSFGR